MTASTFDVVITGGRYFDGTGGPSALCDIGIKDGRIAAVSETPLQYQGTPKVIDAYGHWITPGFLDTHTHYDAEMIVAPSLSESVRHGVTTVLVGSCSLSMICSEAEDASDIFTRVETVPREKVLPILQERKTWSTPRQWVEFVQKQPLGPNLISFLGHSDLRVGTMGLLDSTDRKIKPSEAQMQRMEATLTEAMEAGFLGLSTMCLKWDKIDGDRAWSKSLPSTYARWSELRRLNKILRQYRRVHQGAPNAANPLQIFEYLIETLGWIRKPLKTTLIALIDLKGNKTVRPMAQISSRVVNWLGGAFRWQLLPTPFTVYADGIDVVFFEEFGAGEMALDLRTQVERNSLLQNEDYRRQFRKFYGQKLSPRVWQRDFGDAIILECPDANLVGKNFDEVARARKVHVVDLFLDLVVQFGRQLRWYTTVGNHKREVIRELVQDKHTLITFSDAGAHIRNMAFYNLPLRFLKLVKETIEEGKPIMSMEHAVWRLTGEQADWLGIEAGKIRVGDRADLVVLNPEALNQNLEQVTWGDMENFGLQRLVNRNPGVVKHVLINGKIAVENEAVVPELGKEMGYGQFLPANT
ncbi:amidohydrolase family protein [Limnobacter sp.]|uniref:N-acyl-D-amino-acid deacylase family protein n=1 Tax=Limnobacter sp. TaxID=2003368 RepID=UPI002735EF98|nr:amidohydrolase family protein [Limnobacter sp.]MDP3272604.1 amidohydrolase family protein [Limnobacter sp.]